MAARRLPRTQYASSSGCDGAGYEEFRPPWTVATKLGNWVIYGDRG